MVGQIGEDGSEFFVLLDDLANAVLESVAVKLAGRDRIEFGQVDVRKFDTVNLYGKALTAIEAGNRGEAQGLLTEAMALEPDFKLAESTLGQLAVQLTDRRGQIAHQSLTQAKEAWAKLKEIVDPLAQNPKPADPISLAHLAIRARLHLVDGEFDPYLALQDKRLALTTQHIDKLRASDWDGAFTKEVRRVSHAAGTGDAIKDTVFRIAIFPYEIQMEQAELILRLGDRTRAVNLAISAYQHPGPTNSRHKGVQFLDRWFREVKLIDMQIVHAQQVVKQRELEGNWYEAQREVKDLERLLTTAKRHRKYVKEYQEALRQLEQGKVTRNLIDDEDDAVVGALKYLPEQRLKAYASFVQRVEAGVYDAYKESREFSSLANHYHDLMDKHFDENLFGLLRLQYLLDNHRFLPATNDEEEATHQRELDKHLTRLWE